MLFPYAEGLNVQAGCSSLGTEEEHPRTLDHHHSTGKGLEDRESHLAFLSSSDVLRHSLTLKHRKIVGFL